jgi:hypothetical protein
MLDCRNQTSRCDSTVLDRLAVAARNSIRCHRLGHSELLARLRISSAVPSSLPAALHPPRLSRGLRELRFKLLGSDFVRVNSFILRPRILIPGTDQLVSIPRSARSEQALNFLPDRDARFLLPVGHGSTLELRIYSVVRVISIAVPQR